MIAIFVPPCTTRFSRRKPQQQQHPSTSAASPISSIENHWVVRASQLAAIGSARVRVCDCACVHQNRLEIAAANVVAVAAVAAAAVSVCNRRSRDNTYNDGRAVVDRKSKDPYP